MFIKGLNKNNPKSPFCKKDININLSHAASRDISLEYTVLGSATKDGIDHNFADGTISIQKGNNTATLSISQIIDDSHQEENETIVVKLMNVWNVITDLNIQQKPLP